MAYKVQQFKSRLSQYKFGGEMVLTVFFFQKWYRWQPLPLPLINVHFMRVNVMCLVCIKLIIAKQVIASSLINNFTPDFLWHNVLNYNIVYYPLVAKVYKMWSDAYNLTRLVMDLRSLNNPPHKTNLHHPFYWHLKL